MLAAKPTRAVSASKTDAASAAKPAVVIGFLGTQLDNGSGAGRWDKWRPTVGLGGYPDLAVARVELLCDAQRFDKLAATVCDDFRSQNPHAEIVIHDVALPDPWDFGDVYARMHNFVRGYKFDDERYDYLVHITTGTHVAQICWFALTEARFIPGRLLQTSPPKQQRRDAIGSYSIIDLDLSKYDQIAQRFRQAQLETAAFLKSGIATKNAQFNELIEQIERVAVRSKAPMLLIGPTGAGKSMLAKNLYELKAKQHALKGRFVEVNCATLRGDAAGSALFGHVRGAFTGAQEARPGLLKSADGGLLFLDEIGELGLDEQAMLLRAIEDKRFLPMGSDKEVSSDFQLLAGTNLDLTDAVRAGRFREDLFARLNLWTFYLPGLKERSEDIEPNLSFELARFAKLQGEHVRFQSEAKALYLKFAQSDDAIWSGNFRDLSASITRLATLCSDGRIALADVEAEIQRLRRLWRKPGEASDDSDELVALGLDPDTIDRFDRAQLREVIAVCKQVKSMSAAGRILFQASRQQKASSNDSDRLRKYLAKFELSFEQLAGLK
jgi:transcriptional regulatory protein RtcR